MTISILGIDIAKNTFQLHGADNSGKTVYKKRLARHELAAHIANLPACTVVMEACGGANYWARVFQSSGHSVKLIGTQFVKPLPPSVGLARTGSAAIVQRRQANSLGYQ